MRAGRHHARVAGDKLDCRIRVLAPPPAHIPVRGGATMSCSRPEWHLDVSRVSTRQCILRPDDTR